MSQVGVILAFAFAALAFHLLVNAFGGYGIFRDEYYYIACSKRLAAGYVDHPPSWKNRWRSANTRRSG